jgi:asparagine synthase (glutamine-hydrolysing)
MHPDSKMCGITGLLRRGDGHSGPDVEAAARGMAHTLHHRGPDDRGVWADAAHGLALAHTRLSILDVSTCGHQPMASHDGRYVLVFNGEIYNFPVIRSRLEAAGHVFRSHSDTEVLIEAIAEWGVREAVAQIVGMFAFAVWDREAQTLVLARDRLGEKPLYYGWLGSTFVFASELKALRAHPEWRGSVDRAALTLFLRHGYVPGPYTIYAGVSKLQPGSLLRVTRLATDPPPQPERYWSLEDTVDTNGVPAIGSDREAVDTLEGLLRDAVRGQMVADVPLGAFLSGGIDSSTVVALMQAESASPIRTFTIGVRDPERDEATAARAIAHHLGTEHTELYVQSDDALGMIPRLSTIYDEPFADSSQIPTLLVSELARRSVTVSLSGDGGDELFGGYATYVRGPYLHRRIRWVPTPLRRQLGRALLSPPVLGGIRSTGRANAGLLADRASRLGEILQQRSELAIHRALYSHWLQPESIVRGGVEPPTMFTSPQLPWPDMSFAERMLLVDASTYLPDDLLVKVDRAAMAVSLETRVPMLDHRVVEFAMRLPWDLKIRDGVHKWILRQVLYRHVPRSLVDSPKRGFSVPIGDWLRGPLKEWASRLLDPDRIVSEGFFRPEPIAVRWAEHQKGTCDWSYSLWTILMFQLWYESQAGTAPAAPLDSLVHSGLAEQV